MATEIYKVVYIDNFAKKVTGKLMFTSLYVRSKLSPHMPTLIYEIDQTTTSTTPIFCFAQKEEAENYWREYPGGDIAILKGTTDGKVERLRNRLMLPLDEIDERNYREFWQLEQTRDYVALQQKYRGVWTITTNAVGVYDFTPTEIIRVQELMYSISEDGKSCTSFRS